jgi:hypothetical protein
MIQPAIVITELLKLNNHEKDILLFTGSSTDHIYQCM